MKIRTLAATASVEDLHKEILHGIEYTVVPLIAMVEGVRLGANQDAPELGLAEDFGKLIDSWNNKPVVNGHPKVNGEFVSANRPDVLNLYAFGLTMNSFVEDKKLHMEAWLNTSLMPTLGDDVQEYLKRIDAGEMIEVSVGFYCDVEETSGTYDSEEYQGIWRNFVPDHLAFLPAGTLGACSIEAGCGVPRLNEAPMANAVPKTGTSVPIIPQCGCDGTGKTLPKANEQDGAAAEKPEAVTEDTQGTETTETTPTVAAADSSGEPEDQEDKHKKDKQKYMQALQEKRLEQHSAMVAQALADGITDSDIRSALVLALEEKYSAPFNRYIYLVAFTTAVAVFGSYSEGNYHTYQVEFTITADGAVTFTSEPAEVRMMTRIVPVAATGMVTQETKMPNENGTAAGAESEKPVVQAKKLTAQEYIDEAPVEIREVLQCGMRMQSEKRDMLVQAIKDTGRNKFSEDALRAMSIPDLESLVELANVPDFSGRAAPTRVNTQSSAESNFAPPPPKLFAAKA